MSQLASPSSLDAPPSGISVDPDRRLRLDPAVVSGLAAVSFGHLAVDCCSGIWPIFKTVAHLDLALAGAIATVGSITGNGLQIVFGLLADRGWRYWLLVLGAMLAGAVTLVPHMHSYTGYFVLVVCTAVGAAAFHPAATGTAGSLSRHRKGLTVALFLAGGYTGYALSQIAFTTVWRLTGGVTGLMMVLPVTAALVLARVMPRDHKRPMLLAQHTLSIRAALKPLSVLFVIQVFATAMNTGLVFLLPELLVARGAPRWMVEGGGHFMLTIGACITLIPAGIATDRLGVRTVLLITNVVVAIVTLALLHWAPSAAAILPLVVGFGAFNSANNVAVVSQANRLLPGRGAAVSALLMGLPWCFSACASVIVGTLAAGGTPAYALGWLALAIPITLTFCMLLPAGSHGSRA